ncbi:DUF3592 domain-containing protein [Deminuibacter soli]|uniref:DUF3592 domain-containing protein n=1 Tax=Deminuibacter soli TaxID=2291815 RepID=A0A3E1NCI4_9BACT|nr:DUF3592 domain-containing protein [Deminuibacter soli]RFM25650.1 DUF3592 domain-containing protein [Deminuibacter soli]
MQKTGIIIAVVVTIGFIIFLLWNSANKAKQYRDEHKNYLEATAIVTSVRQTRPGIKRTISNVYTISFTTATGEAVSESAASIGRLKTYAVGDTVHIYYDPANPRVGATDADGLSMDSNIFDGRNILTYIIGLLIVGIVIGIRFKRRA